MGVPARGERGLVTMYSPDGRWWWNGWQWVPVPPPAAAPRSAPAAPAAPRSAPSPLPGSVYGPAPAPPHPAWPAQPEAVPPAVVEPVDHRRLLWLRKFLAYPLLLFIGLMGAEYVSSSSPIPLTQPFNFPAYWPYYLVVFWAAGRLGGLSLRSYYLFGALLGMGMETFVTKVAWGHADGFTPFSPIVGGFGSWELPFLVLTYHPIFSVAIPFLLASHYLGLPAPSELSTKVRRTALAVLPAWAGMQAAIQGQSPAYVAGAFAANAALIAALIALYRFVGARPRFSLGWPGWALVLLVGVGFTILNAPRFLPGPLTVLATLVMWAILALLAWRSVKRDRTDPRLAARQRATGSFTWNGFGLYLLCWAGIEAVCYGILTVLGEPRFLVFLAVTTLTGVAGTCYLLYSAVRLLLPRTSPHQSEVYR